MRQALRAARKGWRAKPLQRLCAETRSVITVAIRWHRHGAPQRSDYIQIIAAPLAPFVEPPAANSQITKVAIMSGHNTARGLRAALSLFSGALLLGLAACNNTYGPPLPNQASLTWGQQHYLEVQKSRQNHDSRRSDSSSSGYGAGRN